MKNGSVRSCWRKLNLSSSDVLDVLQRARVEVVDADHAVAVGEQVIAHVRAEEAGSAADQAGAHRPREDRPRRGTPAARRAFSRYALSVRVGDRPTRPPTCSAATVRCSCRIARRHSLGREDAEDAFQRASEILLTKAPARDPARLIAWMAVVTKHEAHRRAPQPASACCAASRARTSAFDPLDGRRRATRPQPAERAERRAAVAEARRALAELKANERTRDRPPGRRATPTRRSASCAAGLHQGQPLPRRGPSEAPTRARSR